MNTLADSGYFAGLFNPKDHHHARCMAFFSRYAGQTTTSWSVFTEVCALLTHSKQKAFFPGRHERRHWDTCASSPRAPTRSPACGC